MDRDFYSNNELQEIIEGNDKSNIIEHHAMAEQINTLIALQEVRSMLDGFTIIDKLFNGEKYTYLKNKEAFLLRALETIW